MATASIVVFGIVWYASGVFFFCQAWTRDFDLTDRDLVFGLFAGFFGPIVFVFGLGIHPSPRRLRRAPRIIWRRREL